MAVQPQGLAWIIPGNGVSNSNFLIPLEGLKMKSSEIGFPKNIKIIV